MIEQGVGYDLGSMSGMKISISLPDDDVAYLDALARADGYGSRSAVIAQAIRLLRAAQLGDAYEQAWSEWTGDGSAEEWAVAAADGVR